MPSITSHVCDTFRVAMLRDALIRCLHIAESTKTCCCHGISHASGMHVLSE